MYSTHDTDWATSSKGNLWRRINGVVLVVGRNKYGDYWARVGDDFVKGKFPTEMAAKVAAAKEAGGDIEQTWWDSL
jgi:hypothetical protein